MNVKKTKSSKKIVLKFTMSMTVARRHARRIFRLLLHLESCQIYAESSSVDHSLHAQDWAHAEAEWERAPPRKKSGTATARPRAPAPNESPTP